MWATSIGSTFSHSPVPGLRKSGMPDGTEIPAPARATALSEVARSSASSATYHLRPGSFPPETRLPLAEERADPFLRVLRPEGGPEGLGFDPETLVEVPVTRDLLDPLDRQRRLAGELACPRHRRVEQLVVGHDLVDEPDPLRLVGVDRV